MSEHDSSPIPHPAPGGRPRSRGWRTPDLVRASALVLAMYGVALLLWEARALVLLTFLGVLFGLAVAAGVDRLARFRIPRGVAAAVVVVGTLSIIGGVLAWSAPVLRHQSRELREKFPHAIDRVDRWLASHQDGMLGSLLSAGQTVDSTIIEKAAGTPADAPPQATVAGAVRSDTVASRPVEGSALRRRIMGRLGGVTRYLFPFLTSTVAAVGALLYLVFLAVYVGAEPDLYHSGLLQLLPIRARERAAEVLTAMGIALRKWLVTQLIAMLAIGVVTTIALLILRVPAALPLGILAGIFEFIPTVGPVLSAAPAVVMGFVDSPEKAGLVALTYIGIQFLENHILIPLLMREGVDLPPALTIVTQALMALLFGFIGLVVAVPALAAAMVAVRMLYVEGVVGEVEELLDAEDTAVPTTTA